MWPTICISGTECNEGCRHWDVQALRACDAGRGGTFTGTCVWSLYAMRQGVFGNTTSNCWIPPRTNRKRRQLISGSRQSRGQTVHRPPGRPSTSDVHTSHTVLHYSHHSPRGDAGAGACPVQMMRVSGSVVLRCMNRDLLRTWHALQPASSPGPSSPRSFTVPLPAATSAVTPVSPQSQPQPQPQPQPQHHLSLSLRLIRGYSALPMVHRAQSISKSASKHSTTTD